MVLGWGASPQCIVISCGPVMLRAGRAVTAGSQRMALERLTPNHLRARPLPPPRLRLVKRKDHLLQNLVIEEGD